MTKITNLPTAVGTQILTDSSKQSGKKTKQIMCANCNNSSYTHTHTHTRLMALCPGLPG